MKPSIRRQRVVAIQMLLVLLGTQAFAEDESEPRIVLDPNDKNIGSSIDLVSADPCFQELEDALAGLSARDPKAPRDYQDEYPPGYMVVPAQAIQIQNEVSTPTVRPILLSRQGKEDFARFFPKIEPAGDSFMEFWGEPKVIQGKLKEGEEMTPYRAKGYLSRFLISRIQAFSSQVPAAPASGGLAQDQGAVSSASRDAPREDGQEALKQALGLFGKVSSAASAKPAQSKPSPRSVPRTTRAFGQHPTSAPNPSNADDNDDEIHRPNRVSEAVDTASTLSTTNPSSPEAALPKLGSVELLREALEACKKVKGDAEVVLAAEKALEKLPPPPKSPAQKTGSRPTNSGSNRGKSKSSGVK